jgi:rubrerythrin
MLEVQIYPMTKLCLDDNCYNLTKQLAKKLEFLSHSKGYLEDAVKCDSEGSERVWKTIIADEERHAELLRNQLAVELKK